jgi:Family of unknown function (DUF5681)
MPSYQVGYGKPPLSGRFRAGVSGNPKGRPKRKPTPLAERIKSALNAPIKYRERGRTKVATYRELSLKMLVDRAISGDLDAAELALSILDRAERYSDPSLDPILVENWMADYPGQTANQKTADVAAGRDAAPGVQGSIEGQFTVSVPSKARGRRISLGQLHFGQKTAHWALQPHRFKALRCGRRFGKTEFAKTWIAQGLVQGEECAWFAPQHRPGPKSIWT